MEIRLDDRFRIAPAGPGRTFTGGPALGPTDGDGFKMLRMKVDTKVAGGEIITTASELSNQIQKGAYVDRRRG